jgi:SWIM zinc finger
MRAALAGAAATASQILLKVGDEEVTAVTEQASVTERKVALPSRWVKGFGEVSALHARMRLVAELTASAHLPAERTVAALAILASSGKVGYDLADGAYFHRELPLGADVERVHPRLADARELVATSQVALTEGGAMAGGHRVRFGPGQGETAGDTCTCPWWGKHYGTRGPCKHVLAARIALSGSTALSDRSAAGQAR